jgi:hypothetical protein
VAITPLGCCSLSVRRLEPSDDFHRPDTSGPDPTSAVALGLGECPLRLTEGRERRFEFRRCSSTDRRQASELR